MIFFIIIVILVMSQAPIVTAQSGELDLTFMTATGEDIPRILNLINDNNNRNMGYWCDTEELTSVDLLAEWARQTVVRGADNYIISVGVNSSGDIKTVIEGWIYDDTKFLFKSVVWDAQGIDEEDYSLYIHEAVSEIVRQVKRVGVDELHVSATDGTFIRGYVDYLAQSGVNVNDYDFYMSVSNFEAVTVERGLVFDYGASQKRTQIPEPILDGARQLDNTTWIR